MAGHDRAGGSMATLAETERATRSRPLTPDRYERFLALASIVLLLAAALAVVRGRPEWHLIPALIWLHLATIAVALALTPVLLLRVRGTPAHRRLGRLWAGSMLLTALISLGIRESNHGAFSVIHIISAVTLLLVPRLVWTARYHQVTAHRRAVRGLVTGALLLAGFFTFPFDRLLGHWLFG